MDNNLNNYNNNQDSNRNSDNGNNNGNGNRNQGNAPKKQNLLLLLVAILMTLLAVSYLMKLMNGSSAKEITYNEFIAMLDKGEVEINGRIDGIMYTENDDRKRDRAGFLSRLFQ